MNAGNGFSAEMLEEAADARVATAIASLGWVDDPLSRLPQRVCRLKYFLVAGNIIPLADAISADYVACFQELTRRALTVMTDWSPEKDGRRAQRLQSATNLLPFAGVRWERQDPVHPGAINFGTFAKGGNGPKWG